MALRSTGPTRRDLIIGAASLAILSSLTSPAHAQATDLTKDINMGYVTTSDGVDIFYKDWGPKDAQPIVFHHGWPLSSDDWDAQMLFFLSKGYRVIAHDRRGHGRSAQVSEGHDMDHYAADAFAVAEALDLKNAVHIGHSTGGGEVARYVAMHGEPAGRVAKAVLVSAVPPLMVQTEANPEGLPLEVFDGFRAALAANRAQFFRDVPAGPFYGFNRDGVDANEGLQESFWLQGMAGGIKGQYDCIREFSEVDYTGDLRAIKVPTLIVHGDDDQIVPIKASAHRAAEIVDDATLKIYEGGGHGLAQLQAEEFNNDVLAFIRG